MIDFENKKLSNIAIAAGVVFAVAVTLFIILVFIHSSNDTSPREGISPKYLSHSQRNIFEDINEDTNIDRTRRFQMFIVESEKS